MDKHTFDVVIIGSGPLGMASARRLAESGLQIIILESGMAITNPPASHFRNQPNIQADRDGYFAAIDPYWIPLADESSRRPNDLPAVAVSSLMGGQGILWTNNSPRSAKFERWEAMSSDEWDKYYDDAEKILGVELDATEPSIIGRAIQEVLGNELKAEGRELSELPFAGRFSSEGNIHFNAPADILTGLSNEVRERIEIRSGVKVIKLLYQNKQIVGLEISDCTEGHSQMDASLVLVAGGATGSHQLLHRSGIRPQELGKGISFHALLFGQIVLPTSFCPLPNEETVTPRQWIPPTPSKPWHIQILRDTCPLVSTEKIDNAHRLLEFQAFLPVEFRHENMMVIEDDNDVSFRFAFSDKDREDMRAMEADVLRLAKKHGPLRSCCEPIWVPHGKNHLVGTCRMDQTGVPGVANSLCLVHGFDNLYLATTGMFPVPIAVNPTLTAVALALRTCDAIITG